MSNVIVGVNAAFLDVVLRPQLAVLSGSQVVEQLGVQVIYDVPEDEPPFFSLPQTGGAGYDFALNIPQLKIQVLRHNGETSGRRLLDVTFGLQLTGRFELVRGEDDGRLIVHAVDYSVSGGSRLSRTLFRAALDRVVIPELKRSLPAVAIPDLTRLLGFSAEIDALRAANYMLYLLLTVPDAPQVDTPPPTLPQVEAPSIFIAATGAALTASQRQFRIKRGVDEDTDFPLPMGLKLGAVGVHLVGYVEASNLRLNIVSGAPSGSIDLSAGAGLRLNLPPLGRVDLALVPRITPPRFDLDLTTNGSSQQVRAAVQVQAPPVVDWTLSGIPGPVQPLLRPLLRDLLSWVDSSMAIVYDAVDTALRTVRIPIVSLEDFPLPARFESVAFEGNSAVIHIVVSQRQGVTGTL